MPKITDVVPEDKYLRALFTGDPSGGKSIAASSFPNVYVFDIDQRYKSMKNYWVPKGRTDIEYDIYGPDDFRKLDRKMDALIASCPYETVVLDTLTTYVSQILTAIREVKGAPGYKSSSGGEGRKVAGLFTIPDLEDYNAETSAIESTIAALSQIKAHTIMICHLVPSFGSKGLRIPWTAGKKSATLIPVKFNEIYNFELQKAVDASKPPKYICRTVSDGVDFARTQLNLPREIDLTGKSLWADFIEPAMKGASL